MKIYRNIEDFIPLDNAVVTIGTFDGVHIGHQKIISSLREYAQKINGETVLLTFFPHPRMILHPDDDSLRLINTIEEKADRLAESGIDHLIITPFTRDFSNQSAEEYIREILVSKIGTKRIIIGYDHHFGKDRKGSLVDLLKYAEQYHYSVQEIPEQDINDVAVSSTKIREALIIGEIATANKYLGYPFHITGKVVKGQQLGRTIGYPTANIEVPESYKLIPAYGIYAVQATLIEHAEMTTGEYIPAKKGPTLKGMGYIGTRPTVRGVNRSIEINFFDLNEDLYGKTLQIQFLHFVRHDHKFDSIEAMTAQLAEDEKKIKELLA
ncbi:MULTISPECIES: bifunctional riboflavin kinase/FAD synthetase [Olivibacter]|jgi:riboflavin kinase/FMN adenylyltransferase|uniref:Riboflavin biosynthesis protein n=3 Tax=Sphingobacteriaceae TaxID=84566 RepID=F4C7Z6_SPHS2|nr:MULTISPECIES: bifunctional riboflavin kinase/FAD synthetase [Olivibacter]MCL4637958.1 bifunctional riboflavin kinase/FAD synthetase [Olivibacter sp. UJ_SKK_5.1]MDM8174368.1 bifunctional riboflavin kinase/FAD synthetase [Olivibacter sp. 47]MDX3916833.1 bifunctional riboflavin kinase/FAD synthetase [Pseudosphingobacterium sp.]QEL04182.1 bifunctional riboflavin kinase/FAD synthetase [Olivibacter sp. LS-1]